MALPTRAVDGIDRTEVQVAAERRRAARVGEIAARHENLAATAPLPLRKFHEDAATANRRMQERHLVSASIHAAHLARLRAAVRRTMVTSAPGDALLDSTDQADARPEGPDDGTFRDQLTNLPNRRRIAERLAAAIEGDSPGRPRPLAVCLVGLDYFGAINDRLGRVMGNRVLVTVAERLVECAPTRLVGRLGGDEFVVLLENMVRGDEAPALAGTIIAAISEPINVNGNRVSISASVGVALRDAGGTDPAELLRSANVSLGWAKEGGRGRWEIFDRGRDDEATARSALAAELPSAIERGELSVEFQPIVSLADGHLAGAEALVRWRHPRLGVLSPDQFIGLAEERGFISQLGTVVLTQACGAAMRWREITSNPMFVSVNITARQLDDPDLIRQVSSVLDAVGLPPSDLHVEILEGAIVKNTGRSVPTLHRLVELGISIAIDDFGTGYSNLSYLRRLPVKIIKTDRSFITDLCPPDRGPDDTGTEIFSTIVSLAQALGLTILAEGVETAVQAEWLQSMGVDMAQGWHFGRPVQPGELETMIASSAEPDPEGG